MEPARTALYPHKRTRASKGLLKGPPSATLRLMTNGSLCPSCHLKPPVSLEFFLCWDCLVRENTNAKDSLHEKFLQDKTGALNAHRMKREPV